jgi:N-acetylglucosaminyl-diphospho-decaprenol L-rhamnosyltransferase
VTDLPALIVPSYNGAAQLAELLVSLRAQTREHEVVVVDNGSTDGTREILAERFHEAQLVALDRNVGFGRAVNAGVAATTGDPIVLVGNDAVCEPAFVERLCAALHPDAGIVMAAGVLLDRRDARRIDTAGIVFDRTLFAVDYLHGQPVSALDAAPDPLGPSGGAAAFEREAFEQAGGFDEAFFAYLEDVDLVARILVGGGRCRLAPGARAVHRHSATLGSGSRRKNALMGWSRGYTIGKYRLHRDPFALARALLLESAVVGGQLAIDRTGVGLRARLEGFRAGLRAPAHAVPALSEGVSISAALRYRLSRRRSPLPERPEPEDGVPRHR